MSHDSTIGFIGVGVFAGYMVRALRRAGNIQDIILAPRSRTVAEELAAGAGCLIGRDNQDVVDRADLVFLSVKPAQAKDALTALTFRPDQILLSAVAGLSIAQLRELAPSAREIVRIMPAAFVESGLGLFPICPPHPEVEALFRPAGEVVAFDDEERFGAALLAGCLSGWTYRFCHELVQMFMAADISEEQARLLVLGTLRGTINYAMDSRDRTLMDFSDLIATEGSYTKLGLDALFAQHPMTGWQAAISAVNERRREREAQSLSDAEA